jgi:DNA-binding phage protein
MMHTKMAPYDVAKFLVSPEVMAAYPEACIEESEGDTAFIAMA